MTNTAPIHRYQLYPFWDDEFKTLDYIVEPFNDPVSVNQWTAQGYSAKFVGELCDMRHRLPSWSQRFIDIFEGQGWKDVGIAFYRMKTGTVLPVHGDLYKRYVELFDLQGQEHTIRRALVLLEDWKSGHYLELRGAPMVDWRAGQVVEWAYDTPHMAANIGLEDRYTLQITGHIND
jgi:hypothetical protein